MECRFCKKNTDNLSGYCSKECETLSTIGKNNVSVNISDVLSVITKKYIHLLTSIYGIKVWTDSNHVDPEVKLREIKRIVDGSLEWERGETEC